MHHVNQRWRIVRTGSVGRVRDVRAMADGNTNGCGAGRWPCYSHRDSMGHAGDGGSHMHRDAGLLRAAPLRWDEHVPNPLLSRLL